MEVCAFTADGPGFRQALLTGWGLGYKGSLAGYAAACSEEPKGGTSCSSVVPVRAASVSVSHCASSA